MLFILNGMYSIQLRIFMFICLILVILLIIYCIIVIKYKLDSLIFNIHYKIIDYGKIIRRKNH